MLTPKEGSGTPLYLILKYMNDNTIPSNNGQYWADALPQQIPTLEVKSKVYINKNSHNHHYQHLNIDINTLWTTTLALCNLSPLDVDHWIKSTISQN